MKKLTAKDIIAAIMLIGAFTLRGLGIDSLTEYIIIGVGVAYSLWAVAEHRKKGGKSSGRSRD